MPRKYNRSQLPLELAASPTISFRLDDDSARALIERSYSLGVSVHELARHYVMEMLQEHEERAALRDAIRQLHEILQQHRADVAFAVRALLTSAGKVPEDKAEKWVKATIQPET
jgi:hypothetical protein